MASLKKCSRYTDGRWETGAVSSLMVALALTTLSWGCATTPKPDPQVERDLPEDREKLDLEEASELEAIQMELHDLIMNGYVTFDGLHGAVTACLEGQDCTVWNSYAGALVGIAQRAPEDDYVQGQMVYSLVRGDRSDLALVVLEDCRATEWWCLALEGFALAESGRVVEAEAVFDQVFLLMPEQDLCDWNYVGPLVSGNAWSAYEGSSCLERLERMEEFWWLSDPAWVVPGNDRKVEHYNRMAWAALHDDAQMDPSRTVFFYFNDAHNPAHHLEVIRRGMDIYRWDARWGKLCDWPGRWACEPACEDPERKRRARDRGIACCDQSEWPWPYCPYTPEGQTYRVMPEEKALLDPFHASADDWPIEPDGDPEYYVPQVGALISMDAQVAFFERGDSLVAAAAADIPDHDVFMENPPDLAALFLATDPATNPVTVEAAAQGGRWVFRVTAPLRRYIVGIETVVPEAVGRFRSGHGLPHDPVAPLRLSDLLLFTPKGPDPPISLEAVAPSMKGGHRWSQGEVMGVFLEVYGNREATAFPISVELERERGGFARLGEVLGITGGKPVNIQWVEEGPEGRFALSFSVNLGEAQVGDYTLRVSVVGPGMSPATVEQKIEMVEGG